MSNCPILPADQLKDFIDKFAKRKSLFWLSPGVATLILLIFLTSIYIVAVYFLDKSQFKEETEEQIRKSVFENILVYFTLILPICLAFYAWKIFSASKMNYQLYYPETTWPGGMMWSSFIFIILAVILICIVMIQSIDGHTLSAFWILVLVIMAVLISIVVGAMSHILIQTNLTVSPEYKEKFKCAKDQIVKYSQDLLQQAELQKRQAAELYVKSQNMEKDLTKVSLTGDNIENLSDTISRSRKLQDEVGSRANTSSRQSKMNSQPPSQSISNQSAVPAVFTTNDANNIANLTNTINEIKTLVSRQSDSSSSR